MAVQAGNIGAGVAAFGPIHKEARSLGFVAFDTSLGLGGHAALDAKLLDLGEVCGCLLLGRVTWASQGQKQRYARQCYEFFIHRPTLLLDPEKSPSRGEAP
jgi:hypothetical protein